MLKVCDILNVIPIGIEIDYYVPINIIFGEWDPSIEPTACWYTGNLKNTLLEVGLGEEKGKIRFITLVGIKDIRKDTVKISCDKVLTGLPAFETKAYNEKNLLVEEPGPLKMIIDQNNVYILFSDNEIDSEIICGQVAFFLDKDNFFCGVKVENLSDSEIQFLEDNFL